MALRPKQNNLKVFLEILEIKPLIFVPAYRCEKFIKKVINKLDKESFLNGIPALIVDNCSPDKTLDESILASRESTRTISIIQNNQNYGLGGSHKTAFRFALKNNFTHLCIIHGDDQGDPKDLAKLIYHLQSSSKNFHNKNNFSILGARFQKGSQLKGYSFSRYMGNIIFNFLFSISLKRRIYDLGAGINIFSINDLKSNKILEVTTDDLCFNYMLLVNLLKSKSKIIFKPIKWVEEDQISNVKVIQQLLKLIKIWLQSFKKLPFKNFKYRTLDFYNYKLIEEN